MSDSTEWRLDDSAAEYFEAHFVPAIFARWAPILIDAARVAAGQRVLDVACGTGIVARVAADQLGGPDGVTGFDLNASMLGVARRLRPDILWEEGDATDMPFADASFDAVLCQAAMMFFPDPTAAAREMYRVLAPGGVVATLVWGESAGYEAMAQLLGELVGTEVADIFRAPFSMADPQGVCELFEQAGFEAPTWKTHEHAARYESIEAFVKTEVDGWVLHRRVDVDALIPAARDRLEPYVMSDGAVAIPMAGHVVTSTKTGH